MLCVHHHISHDEMQTCSQSAGKHFNQWTEVPAEEPEDAGGVFRSCLHTPTLET